MEKWCKGDQAETWGFVKGKTSFLILWKKSNVTTAVYSNVFSVSAGNTYLQKHSFFAITNSSGRSTKQRDLPALNTLLTMNRSFFVFSSSVFPTYAYETYHDGSK